jgi:hypothetical protein
MRARRRRLLSFALVLSFSAAVIVGLASPSARPRALVGAVDDFALTGDGSDAAWSKAEWNELARRGDGLDYSARFKTVYSSTGIYFLIEGSDQRVSATITEDFANLWTEDVFEVFLWTDERHPVYFEYEISPLGKELPIIIPNFDGRFLGWRPWHYEGSRRTRTAVSARGGVLLPGADIRAWSAEVFLPYELLSPLANVPPKAGTTWRANVYRVDHDHGKKTAWHWAPVGESFHEFESFGTLEFASRAER